MSFRSGVIDSTDSYGKPDARVSPPQQLALLTWTMTCAPEPSLVRAVASHHVVVTYAVPAGAAGCAASTRLFPFTAVVQLPPSVSAEPPPSVTVRLPGRAPYSTTARR